MPRSMTVSESTAIVVHSDHGFHLGEHGRWSKYTLYEDATRVPLIVATPNGARGVGARRASSYHGDRLLSSKERKQLYANSFETQPTFTPPQFATVDTEFQLVDSSLYCQANRRNMSSASFSLKSPPLFLKKSSFFKEKVSSPIF